MIARFSRIRAISGEVLFLFPEKRKAIMWVFESGLISEIVSSVIKVLKTNLDQEIL